MTVLTPMRLHRFAALCALTLFAGACATTQSAKTGPAPASEPTAEAAPADPILLWEVSQGGEGPVMWLFGSIHVRPGEARGFDQTVQDAWSRAGAVVVEVNVAAVDPVQMQNTVLAMGMLTDGSSLEQHLGPELWALVLERAEKFKLPAMAVARMKPWLVALTLQVLDMQSRGYKEEAGVDRGLLQMTMQAETPKPIFELETLESQLGLFAEMDAELQRLMLEDSLLQMREDTDFVGRLYAAWAAGDAAALEKEIFRNLERQPKLAPFYEKVFYARNRSMTASLEALLAKAETPQPLLVTLGAGHMVGDQGIVALLKQKGYRVRQLSKGGLK